MKRVDLYGDVHKGIRKALFETTLFVARCDFERAPEATAAAQAVGRLIAFLDEHAEHEDQAILPELARVAPELFIDLRAEHARTDGLQRELIGLVERLAGSSVAERIALGLRIHERLGLLVAEHLRHLAHEEREVNRVLWAHFSDDELREIEGRILAGIAPARMAEWMELMLPALSASECRALLAGMRAALPADAFAGVTAPARAALGESAWQAALSA